MKKIIINMSDTTYEKLRFEAIQKQESIEKVVADRIMEKPFDKEVEEAIDTLFEKSFQEVEKELGKLETCKGVLNKLNDLMKMI